MDVIAGGFLNLHKPLGLTSHDCVSRVRRLLNTKRVGHGGTLDPLATGVLPIAVGSVTRLLQFLPAAKVYQAVIRFGVTTQTDDLEGAVLQTFPTEHLSLPQIQAALGSFQGDMMQVPPAYSAIQVQGQRLYNLARQGQILQPPSRQVSIFDIRILEWQPHHQPGPELTVEIACGPGTYIRAIARDLGHQLQTGGTLAGLVRLKSCGFDLADSITFDELTEQVQGGMSPLIAPGTALRHLPALHLDRTMAWRWCQGQKLPGFRGPLGALSIWGPGSIFLGVGKIEADLLRSQVVVARPEQFAL